MTISFREKFTGYHWEAIAKSVGASLVFVCLGAGVLGFFTKGSLLNSTFLIFVGLVTAIWEIPSSYIFIPQCEAVTEFALTRLKLCIPAVRAALYLMLAVICLFGKGFYSTPVGVAFLISSMLNLFAQVNVMSDLQDGTASGGVKSSSQHGLLGEGMEAKKTPGFGTF